MGNAGFVFTLVVTILTLAGVLFIRGSSAVVFVVAIAILAVMSLVGLKNNLRWGWPASIVLFSLVILGVAWLHYVVSSVILAFVLLLNVLAFLVALVAVDLWEPAHSSSLVPPVTVYGEVDALKKLADELLPAQKKKKK